MARPKLKLVKNPTIENIIATMDYRFMACRCWGHAWKPFTVDIENVKRHKHFHETLACARCDMRRRRTLNESGEIVEGNHYSYPAGYLIPGWGKMSKDDRSALRIGLIRIILSGNEIQEIEVS